MSKSSNPFEDYVFSLSEDEFKYLIKAIDSRIDFQKYGYTAFEEAAIHFNKTPLCPNCLSSLYHLDGKTNANHKRYRCHNRNTSYTLLGNSIFSGAKISLHKLGNYIELMTFNVPLELMCEVLNISTNTAELWRKKIFSTVNDYQDNLMLSNNVY